VLAENEQYVSRLTPVSVATDAERRESSATVYRDRGLSSDTSLRVNFALEKALTALRDRGELTRSSLNRVAVIGPGLDFIDKAQGYDFYPVQMIQPFAIADSLLRLGLATRPSMTALDISPRILSHVRQMQECAARNQPYRLNLVLEQDTRTAQTEPALIEYWQRLGAQIGAPTPAEVPNAYATRVRARAIAVRPRVVLDVTSKELNVVVGRVASASAGGAFDAIVATNVLVYYDAFEQALAVANMADMLAPGGVLLTNQPVPVPGAAGLSATLIASVDFDRLVTSAGSHQRGDSIYAYTKK
jgi:SAM-dependent methyltransferase